jgi:hypothetical protein
VHVTRDRERLFPVPVSLQPDLVERLTACREHAFNQVRPPVAVERAARLPASSRRQAAGLAFAGAVSVAAIALVTCALWWVGAFEAGLRGSSL